MANENPSPTTTTPAPHLDRLVRMLLDESPTLDEVYRARSAARTAYRLTQNPHNRRAVRLLDAWIWLHVGAKVQA